MLDIAVAYNRYRFLGNEFLTWIWFLIETDQPALRQSDAELAELTIGNRMVLENRLANGMETVSIKGDAAGLEEALLALSKGAWITEVNLVYKSGSLEWAFSLKGESLSLSGLKLPETAATETDEDVEGLVLEKLYLYEKPLAFIDGLYSQFIQERLSDAWQSKILPRMRLWMKQANEEKRT
ncbi:MAG: hypothetical protein P8X55_20215 [Desulfosarcinaceae bacterium]